MREIKFRFGWYVSKDIRNPTGPREWIFEFYTIDLLTAGVGDNESFSGYKTRDEYTGLKDKNGKEIYEGDFLQSFYPVKLERGEEAEYIGRVAWSEKSCAWVLVDEKDKFAEMLCRTEAPEIIGNIYENPELLQKQGTRPT